MNCDPIRRLAAALCFLVGTAITTSCAGPAESPIAPSFAKAASGPSVTASNPSYGHEGEVSKQVTITGSGFAPGAQAAWERSGVADPKIQVVSTQYVSSTQVVATITIAGDAALSLYDISVTNSDRKKGIGYALFEVTQATAITGTEIAFGVNANGEIVGRVGTPGAFYFSQLAGLTALGSPGRALDISGDGITVAGGNSINSSNTEAYLYTNAGGLWQKTTLPRDPAACIATARAIGSDAFGAAVFVGGVENGGCYSGKNLHRQPRIWTQSGGSWVKNVLPGGPNTDDMLDDVNGAGIAVGTANGKAAVWTPNGLGGWSLVLIGASGSALHAVNNTATLAVGETNGVAQYWTFSGGTWSGPVGLPGGCTSAVSIDVAGNILANGCSSGNRQVPAVILPPYAAGNVLLLGGLGDSRAAVTANDISATGGWIVGQASLQNTGTGVYWKIF